MSNVLENICMQKRAHVRARMTACPISTLLNLIKKQTKPRGFATALAQASKNGYGLIAEIKKSSPSKGLLRKILTQFTYQKIISWEGQLVFLS